MRPVPAMRRMRGLSLIEMMVSLAIGSVMIIGAISVYGSSRNTYAVNDALGRLQEQARYVMTVVEPDVALGGYYGFTNSPDTLRLINGANPGIVLASAPALRQHPLPPLAAAAVPAPGLPASAQACGTNFAVDILSPVQGSNDSFALGPARTAACAPWGAGAVAGTDTLTVRRVSTETSAADAGRLQVYASRLSSRTAQEMFFDGVAPGPVDADHEIHDLIVRAYYIARDSVDRAGQPALRVKSLTNVGGAAGFVDTEVMPGVEDLQVQFGIDTGDYDNDGVIDPAVDVNNDGIAESDGRATRYVDADFPGLDRAQVVAVRIWIRVRAEQPEPGFIDNKTYRYGNISFTPAGAQRNFRRVLLSRTITLRNSRTL